MALIQLIGFCVFTAVFTVEAAVKMHALSISTYFTDNKLNVLDFGLLIMLWVGTVELGEVEAGRQSSNSESHSIGSWMIDLQALRILRVYEFISTYDRRYNLHEIEDTKKRTAKFSEVITVMYSSNKALAASFFLFLYMAFMFAVVGEYLFQGKSYIADDVDDHHLHELTMELDDDGTYESGDRSQQRLRYKYSEGGNRLNFHTFSAAYFTTISMAIARTGYDTFKTIIFETDPEMEWLPILFYVAWMFTARFILFSLLTSTLLEAVEKDVRGEVERSCKRAMFRMVVIHLRFDRKELKNAFESWKFATNVTHGPTVSLGTHVNVDLEQKARTKSSNRSWNIFPETSMFRFRVTQLLESSAFKAATFLVVLISVAELFVLPTAYPEKQA